MIESGVKGVVLPRLQDHWGLQEGVEGLSIKLYKLAPDSDLSQGLVLWIVKISIEFLDQGHINVTVRLLGQGSVPSLPLELPVELVILRDI